MKNIVYQLGFLLLCISFFPGCSGAKKGIRNPSWTKIAPSFNRDRTVLRAVGSSADMGQEGVSWRMAELSARKRMALVMSASVEAYERSFKNYSGGEMIQVIFKESHQKGYAEFTNMDTQKRWYNPETKRYYMLVTVRFGIVSEILKKKIKAKPLPEKEQQQAIQAVMERSDAAKKRLSEKLKNMKWE